MPHFKLFAALVGTALLVASPGLGGEKKPGGDALPLGAKFRLGSERYHLPVNLFYPDISKDGQVIAFSLGDLVLLDLRTGKAAKPEPLHVMPQAQLIYSPDDTRFAT